MGEFGFAFATQEIGVVEANQACPGPSLALYGSFYSDRAAQGMIHQVAVRETKIGFVAEDAPAEQALAQGANFARKAHGDSGNGLSRQGAEFGLAKRCVGLRSEVMAVASAHEEVGLESVVFHQESPPGLQPSIKLDDGPVPMDPVSGLEDHASVHCLNPSGEEVGAK